MSSQTIYIQPDEEVTSLVSRLRRMEGNELILIVPQRSVILEGLINLQLLKKQMDVAGKRLVCVTQDEQGATAARRAGIEVMSKSDASALMERATQRPVENENSSFINEVPAPSQGVDPTRGGTQENGRETSRSESSAQSTPTRTTSDMQPRRRMSDGIFPTRKTQEFAVADNSLKNFESERKETSQFPPLASSSPPPKAFSPHSPVAPSMSERPREEQGQPEDLGYVYQHERPQSVRQPWEQYKTEALSSENRGSRGRPKKKGVPTSPVLLDPKKREAKIGARVIMAIIAILIVGSGYTMWTYIPKAHLEIAAARIEASGDVSVSATPEAQGEKLPSQILTQEVNLNEMFTSSGSQDADTRRATGTVTIYNEYSNEDQPLVATTRLLTDDGKLYRLVESVVVPGREGEGEGMIPGKVAVTVRADVAGEEYNIEPSTFRIPGFEGSPKYDAFYAESQETFVGGGTTDENIAIVSDADVENAKVEMESRIRDRAKEVMRDSLGEEWELIDDTIEVEEKNSYAFPSAGTVAQQFEYTVGASVRVMAVRTSDLHEQARLALQDRAERTYVDATDVSWVVEDVTIQLGKSIANYEEQSLDLRYFAEVKWRAEVDEVGFKRSILGKSPKDVEQVLSEHSGIQQVNIEVTPSTFFSRISTLPSRVTVELE